jgi:hypothetical protein
MAGMDSFQQSGETISLYSRLHLEALPYGAMYLDQNVAASLEARPDATPLEGGPNLDVLIGDGSPSNPFLPLSNAGLNRCPSTRDISLSTLFNAMRSDMVPLSSSLRRTADAALYVRAGDAVMRE